MTRGRTPLHPTLAQLRALLAVADAGGFSEAAAELGMSQSSLSEAVSKLEELLERPLLRRTPAGTQLTAAGDRVLSYARTAVQAAGDVLLAAQDEKLSGVLRLASYRSTATHLLPPVLAAFRALHPDVKVTLLDSESDACGGGEQAVRSGYVDAAVVARDDAADLHLTPLALDEYVFVAPESRGLHPFTLDEIAGQTLFLPPARDSCHLRIREYLHGRAAPLNTVTENAQDSVILGMVAHGLGVTIMPRLALMPLPDGLVTLPLPEPLQRPLALAVQPQRANLPILRAFTETLGQVLHSAQPPRTPSGRDASLSQMN